MMSVLEYANDVNRSVNDILNLCQKLNINLNSQDDMLDEDMIILLDNEIDSLDLYEEDTIDDDFEDSYTKELERVKPKNKKKDVKKNDDFLKLRKDMYKHKEKLQSNKVEDSDNVILYKDNMSVSDFASLVGISAAELIKKVMELGTLLNINAVIDFEIAEIIASEYGYILKKDTTRDEVNFEELETIEKEEDLVKRAPVVTIMGHVDHGKTTLLDTIRKTNVASFEAGGITQAIGAYQIDYKGNKITFIDTPGHAAFTQMRARCASITDIVVIIVAADDGVMPQTKEAIDHAKAANVPIIVAVNKIDKPDANPDKVLSEMAQNGVTPEAWGGDVMFVNISAKTSEGIDDLLDRIILLSDISSLKANPNRYAKGTVLESKMDKNSGIVATLLIENGTLRLGDSIVAGNTHGRVRTLKNDRAENLVEAYPSMPVTITGLSDSPSAGDKFMVFENEKKARTIALQRLNNSHKLNIASSPSMNLEDLFNKINSGCKEINIILKADVKGSEEAVKSALLKINVEGVKINIIRSDIGTITESDIVLAQASNALIIGFNIKPNNKTLEFAKEKNVDIRLYNIIYKVVEEMEDAMLGKLDPEYEEKTLGEAEVRKLFKFSKVGTIAGSYVTSGVIKRDAKARIIRDGVIIYDGNINSVAREKDQVKEVKQGLECGITIENFNDIKENDVIEAYEIVEIKKGR